MVWLRGLFVLALAAGAPLWAQQLSKEYIHAGDRLLAVEVPAPGITATALTATLLADRHLITAGASATLTWATTNAGSVTIDQGVGAVTPVEGGSVSVTPSTTTTYTLTATGEAGSISVMPGITATLSADPFQIASGESTTLEWTTSGATSVTIDQGVGAVTPVEGGSVSVTPSATTAYTLTATGESGIASATASVIVDGVTACPVIDSFSASPTTITSSESSTLE